MFLQLKEGKLEEEEEIKDGSQVLIYNSVTSRQSVKPIVSTYPANISKKYYNFWVTPTSDMPKN